MSDFNNKYSLFFDYVKETGEVFMKNIEGVARCPCGLHPVTSRPIITKSNMGDPVTKIFAQLSPPRSGSTVVYQIMNEMFPDKVEKSHEFKDVCPFIHDIRKIIVTVRHPYDIAASMLRQNGNSVDSMFETFKKGMRVVRSSMASTLLIGNCRQFIELPGCEFLFLRYEDFYGKDIDRVKEISEFLNVNMSPEEMTRISRKFSIEENKKVNDKKLQENHIGPTNGVPMRDYQDQITRETKNMLYSNHKWYFDTFEYEG